MDENTEQKPVEPVVEPAVEPEKPKTLEEKFESLVKLLAEHGIHVR